MVRGPKPNRKIYERIQALKVGEELIIGRSDWKARTPPRGNLLHHQNYRGQFLVRTIEDQTGWTVLRLRPRPDPRTAH
jgi:hypothetical protein